MTEFKMPEQFAKIGDRIVAIPMISEEQQKQTVLEEKKLHRQREYLGHGGGRPYRHMAHD